LKHDQHDVFFNRFTLAWKVLRRISMSIRLFLNGLLFAVEDIYYRLIIKIRNKHYNLFSIADNYFVFLFCPRKCSYCGRVILLLPLSNFWGSRLGLVGECTNSCDGSCSCTASRWARDLCNIQTVDASFKFREATQNNERIYLFRCCFGLTGTSCDGIRAATWRNLCSIDTAPRPVVLTDLTLVENSPCMHDPDAETRRVRVLLQLAISYYNHKLFSLGFLNANNIIINTRYGTNLTSKSSFSRVGNRTPWRFRGFAMIRRFQFVPYHRVV